MTNYVLPKYHKWYPNFPFKQFGRIFLFMLDSLQCVINSYILIACEQAHLRLNWGKEKKGEGKGKGKWACRDDIQSGVFCIPSQYAEILAIPLFEKCEVGGQWIFVRNSFQITVRRDSQGYKVLVEVLEKFRSASRMYVQKPEQKEATEHLLKGRNILAV